MQNNKSSIIQILLLYLFVFIFLSIGSFIFKRFLSIKYLTISNTIIISFFMYIIIYLDKGENLIKTIFTNIIILILFWTFFDKIILKNEYFYLIKYKIIGLIISNIIGIIIYFSSISIKINNFVYKLKQINNIDILPNKDIEGPYSYTQLREKLLDIHFVYKNDKSKYKITNKQINNYDYSYNTIKFLLNIKKNEKIIIFYEHIKTRRIIGRPSHEYGDWRDDIFSSSYENTEIINMSIIKYNNEYYIQKNKNNIIKDI